jgi:hypothetical protein
MRICVAVNRRAFALGALTVFLAASHAKADVDPETAAKDVVTRFERALQDHDVPAVAVLVADDVVVFENGHRNDGWQDFRDNHHALQSVYVKAMEKAATIRDDENTVAWFKTIYRAFVPT